jgi:hypothetical protein
VDARGDADAPLPERALEVDAGTNGVPEERCVGVGSHVVQARDLERRARLEEGGLLELERQHVAEVLVRREAREAGELLVRDQAHAVLEGEASHAAEQVSVLPTREHVQVPLVHELRVPIGGAQRLAGLNAAAQHEAVALSRRDADDDGHDVDAGHDIRLDLHGGEGTQREDRLLRVEDVARVVQRAGAELTGAPDGAHRQVHFALDGHLAHAADGARRDAVVHLGGEGRPQDAHAALDHRMAVAAIRQHAEQLGLAQLVRVLVEALLGIEVDGVLELFGEVGVDDLPLSVEHTHRGDTNGIALVDHDGDAHAAALVAVVTLAGGVLLD